MALGDSGIAATRTLSAEALAAIAYFGRLPSVKPYQTRRGSRGRCHAASVAFALWLRVAGVENRIIRALGPRPGLHRHLSELELEVVEEVVQHAVLVEEALVVDFTWRMWNSAHPFPRISTLEEYAADFARLDETVCDVCGAYEHFNGSRPDCRHLTPEEERRVVDRFHGPWSGDIGIVARRLIAETEDARTNAEAGARIVAAGVARLFAS